MADLVVLGFDSRHEAEEVFELGEEDLIKALQS